MADNSVVKIPVKKADGSMVYLTLEEIKAMKASQAKPASPEPIVPVDKKTEVDLDIQTNSGQNTVNSKQQIVNSKPIQGSVILNEVKDPSDDESDKQRDLSTPSQLRNRDSGRDDRRTLSRSNQNDKPDNVMSDVVQNTNQDKKILNQVQDDRGVQDDKPWIPASAGMTDQTKITKKTLNPEVSLRSKIQDDNHDISRSDQNNKPVIKYDKIIQAIFVGITILKITNIFH